MNAVLESIPQKSSTHHSLDKLYAGIHPQEDRDARIPVKVAGTEKKLWNMIRIRVPVGRLSPDQYLALSRLSERFTYNNSLRLTAGQGIQLHGVKEAALGEVLKAIKQAGLASGCHSEGFEFAVATSSVPLKNESYRLLRAVSSAVCKAFYPEPGRGDISHPEHQPRKFTIGLGLIDDNSANVFANDIGLLVLPSSGKTKVNLYAGGSLSMPGRRPDTYARLGSLLGSIDADQTVSAIKAITRVFAAHGQMATRRYTRLKYVVDELGVEKFRDAVEQEIGCALQQPIPVDEVKIPEWSGLREQGDGLFFYGLNVPYGRIQDSGFRRYKSAIEMIVETYRPQIILAPDQNIIFSDLRREHIEGLEKILSAYHIPFGDQLSPVRFEAMACAGLPTCPLAVAESERVAAPILDALEAELFRIGKKDSPFSFRISGCSIGCIRPNMVDLGAVGRKPWHYDLFLGGSEATRRFGDLYACSVPLDEIISTIRPVLEFWGLRSEPGENFSGFYDRFFGSGKNSTRLALAEAIPARDRVEQTIRDYALKAGRDRSIVTAKLAMN